MALTLVDRHKRIYYKNRAKGLTHKETLERVPLEMREQFLKDVNSTFSESHFGTKDFITNITVLVVILLLATLFVVGLIFIAKQL